MATRHSSFFPDGAEDLHGRQAPLRTDQVVAAVEAMLLGLGLPVLQTHARYSKGAGGLIFSVTLSQPHPIKVLAAVEPMVASRVNRGRAIPWRTLVFWRYQFPICDQSSSDQPSIRSIPTLQPLS